MAYTSWRLFDRNGIPVRTSRYYEEIRRLLPDYPDCKVKAFSIPHWWEYDDSSLDHINAFCLSRNPMVWPSSRSQEAGKRYMYTQANAVWEIRGYPSQMFASREIRWSGR